MNIFKPLQRLWELFHEPQYPHGIQPHKYRLFQFVKAGPVEGWITGIEYTPRSLVLAQDGWVEGWGYCVAAYLGYENSVTEYNHNVVQHIGEDEIEEVLNVTYE